MHLLEYTSTRYDPRRQRRLLLSIERVALLELLQNTDLDLARVPVLGDSSNDLDRNSLVGLRVDSLHDLAKSSLAEEAHSAVCMGVNNA